MNISIIIPAYNEECYLGQCLDAIAQLSFKPYEVIVVDNNSTDKTAKVAARYPFVKVLHEKKQGRVFAQIAGFGAATGEILARIDADAVVPASWTANIKRYYDKPDAQQTAWTGSALFYNVRLPRVTSALYGAVAFGYNRLLTGEPSLWGSSMALPRKMWSELAPKVCRRSDLHEDLDLSIHVRQAGYKIVHDKTTFVGVELRPAYAGPKKVWEYLLMWPRTLKIHGLSTWVFCWPVNIVIFIFMPFFGISERIARLFGRKPLDG